MLFLLLYRIIVVKNGDKWGIELRCWCVLVVVVKGGKRSDQV